MHEILTRSHLRPREREGGWNWSIRTGPACKAGDHTRAESPWKDRDPAAQLVGWRM
jgi:hypothetical protein